MSVDYMVSQIYADIITRVTSTEDDWKAVCRLMGQIYRYDFDNVLLVYAQKPSATLVADYDTWKKVNRYVKRGSKGIAIFPTPLLRSNVRHVFDISDTGGRKQKLTWNLEGDNLPDYLGLLKSEREIEGEIATDREGQLNQLKAFTKREIGVIIKEDFSERFTEIVMLAGHVLTGEKNKTPELATQMLVENSVFYAVGTRCGFDLSSEELDLSSIVDVADESYISVLGSLVCDVSCTVLRTFNRNITKLENERRMKYGSISNQLSRGNGRSAVSEHQHGGAGKSDIRQIRDNGNGVSESRTSAEIPQFAEVQSAEPEAERSGGGSESVDGETGKAVSSEEQTTQSGVHDGEISNPHAGKDAGGGDSKTSDREQISLEVEQELNKELEELNSIGVSSDSTKGDATYQQASLFDYMDMPKPTAESFMDKLNREIAETEAQGKYHLLNPKKETNIPHDYIVETLLHGSGYEGGKKRIIAMYQDIPDKKERVKAIKKEYGQGGAGWPLKGYGLHGYDSFHGKGLRLNWRDEEGEKEGYLSWNTMEAEIGALILSGEYHLSAGEYLQRLGKAEEGIESTVEELDEYAIPDEVEEMGITDAMRFEQEQKESSDSHKSRNYTMDIFNRELGGAKTRFQQNVEAVKTLKAIEAEGRSATEEEQKVLAKYAGWGGTAQAFDEHAEGWSKEYKQLKELLSEEEYREARATVNTAFYTPPEIAAVISQSLLRFGFRQGNVLEPSVGVGHFFGTMPEKLRGSKLFGVEKDSVSGRIARQLYPEAKIEIKGFEETDYQDNFFDVVIGNVPFGDYKVYDTRYNAQNFKIHDYFVAKSIDKVRPGGIVAVITTKGTMDKKNNRVRKYLAERAELIGAVRLPNSAFKAEAGTKVTSDILFFQKREQKITIEPDWVHLGMTEDGIPVNSYFAKHPEMVLGHMEYDTGRYGSDFHSTICVNDEENFNLYEALQRAAGNIFAQLQDFEALAEEEEKGEESILANPDVKNYTYAFVDGVLFFRKDSRMYRQEVGEKVLERIRGMDKIRSKTRHLINIQLSGCSEEELKTAQKEMNLPAAELRGIKHQVSL